MAIVVLDSFIVIFNVTVFIFLTMKHLQKSKTVSIVDRTLLSLSVADVLVGISGILQNSGDAIFSEKAIKNPFVISLKHQITKLSLGVSAFHLVILATERLCAVYKPLVFRYKLKDKHTVLALIFSWVLTCTILVIAVLAEQSSDDNRLDNWVFTILAGMCSLFLAVSYLLIYKTYQRNNRRIHAEPAYSTSFKDTQISVINISNTNGIAINDKDNGNDHIRFLTSDIQTINSNSFSSHRNVKDTNNSQSRNTLNDHTTHSSNRPTIQFSDTLKDPFRMCSSSIFPANVSCKTSNTIIHLENSEVHHGHKLSRRDSKSRKVLYLGISISVAFIVCFLPYMVYGSVVVYNKSLQNTFLVLMAIARINSLINPVIYFWFQYGNLIVRRLDRVLSQVRN